MWHRSSHEKSCDQDRIPCGRRSCICFWLCAREWHDLLRPWAWVSQTATKVHCRSWNRPMCLSIGCPISTAENFRNRLFVLILLADTSMQTAPPQRHALVWVCCDIANQAFQDHQWFFSWLGRGSGQVSNHILTLQQVSWQVKKDPHTCSINRCILMTKLSRAIRNFHFTMSGGLLAVKPLGKTQEFARLIKVFAVYTYNHLAIFHQLMGALQKGDFISRLWHEFDRDCIFRLQRRHKFFHHDISTADDEEVVHMDHHETITVLALWECWDMHPALSCSHRWAEQALQWAQHVAQRWDDHVSSTVLLDA